MLVDLGQGHGFVQLAELVLVGRLVDDLLKNEGLDELVLAPLELRHLSLGGGPQGSDVFLPGLPDIQDDGAEEAHKLRARPETLKEAHELGLQVMPPKVRLAAAGLRRAVIVGVALALAMGPGAGERLAAVAASGESPKREVRVVALLRHDLAVRGEQALASPEGVFVNQGRPVAGGLNVPGSLDDPADVDAVGEHLAPLLRGQLAVLPSAETPLGHLVEHLCLGVQAGGIAIEA
ncbi:MAG TPA: hypothetical protein VH394_20420 [Thermoanaerobaculia bacterium]|nr:hypothetical protein [Thermoanaerobaculia bacterium]